MEPFFFKMFQFGSGLVPIELGNHLGIFWMFLGISGYFRMYSNIFVYFFLITLVFSVIQDIALLGSLSVSLVLKR